MHGQLHDSQAYQLHFLEDYTDTDHGYYRPDEENIIFYSPYSTTISPEYYFTNGQEIPSWNYVSPAQMIEGNTYIPLPTVPYFDYNGEGLINVVDVVDLLETVMGNQTASVGQKERMHTYLSDGSDWSGTTDDIQIPDVVSLINIIFYN